MFYYYCFVCVVRYMCLSCSIDLVSICANKKIYNNNNVVSSAYINMWNVSIDFGRLFNM